MAPAKSVSLETIRKQYGDNSPELYVASYVAALQPKGSNDSVKTVDLTKYLKDPNSPLFTELKLLSFTQIDNMKAAFKGPAVTAEGVKVGSFKETYMQNLATVADADKNGALTLAELDKYLVTLGTGAYTPYGTIKEKDNDRSIKVPQDGSLLVLSDDRMAMVIERIAVKNGDKTMLSLNVIGTHRVVDEYEVMWHYKRYPAVKMVGYRITGANMRERMELDKFGQKYVREQLCKFHQEPGGGYYAAEASDYEMGNKVNRVRMGIGEVTGDQGHLKACDSRSDAYSTWRSCSLGNNGYQYGETNRQSYKTWEDGHRIAVREHGAATVFIGDLFLSPDGKKQVAIGKWKNWTLGENKRGTYGVMSYKVPSLVPGEPDATIVLVDPRSKKPILFEDVDVKVLKPGTADEHEDYKIDPAKKKAFLEKLKAKYPEARFPGFAALVDKSTMTLTRSLPIPSHRFMTSAWENKDGVITGMSAWIAPNSYTLPTKEYAFSSLITSPYVAGAPKDSNGWQTTVDTVERLIDVNLYSVMPDKQENAMEADTKGFPAIDPSKVKCLDKDDGNLCTIMPEYAPKPPDYAAMKDAWKKKADAEKAAAAKAAEEAAKKATQVLPSTTAK